MGDSHLRKSWWLLGPKITGTLGKVPCFRETRNTDVWVSDGPLTPGNLCKSPSSRWPLAPVSGWELVVELNMSHAQCGMRVGDCMHLCRLLWRLSECHNPLSVLLQHQNESHISILISLTYFCKDFHRKVNSHSPWFPELPLSSFSCLGSGLLFGLTVFIASQGETLCLPRLASPFSILQNKSGG